MEQSFQLSPKMRRTLLGAVPVFSPLYKLHPVTRLFILFSLGMIPIFIDLPEINFVIIIFILLWLYWARVDFKTLRIYLPLVFTVALFMFTVSILLPTSDPSYHKFYFLGITFYLESLYWTFASYVRLIALILGTVQYFATNRESEILVAVRTLKVPFVVTYFLSLSIRSASMFLEDFRTIRQAERARGLDERSLAFNDRVKLYGMYLIPLFSLAIRRTDEISNALYARGYTLSGKVEDGGKRTDYGPSKYRFAAIDLIVILMFISPFLAVVVLRTGFGIFVVSQSPLRQYLIKLLAGS